MEFEVIRSNRKSMAVEIKLNKLIIRAPMQATNEDINAFMLKNKAWIEKHLAKAKAQQQQQKKQKYKIQYWVKMKL